MVRRLLSSMLFATTALVMSCAANPTGPSPKKEEPPVAFELRAPDAMLTHARVERRQAGTTDAPV
jgi:hypothetical protein